VSQGAMADLEILAQSVQRQERAHLLGKELGQELERREVPDRLEVAHVLAEEAIEPLLLPAAQRPGRLRQERLRETAALQQRFHELLVAARRQLELLPGRNRLRPCLRCDLGDRERVQAVVVVPPCSESPPRR